jgi:hypothetical protein
MRSSLPPPPLCYLDIEGANSSGDCSMRDSPQREAHSAKGAIGEDGASADKGSADARGE